ncbi:hypothetical protein [Paraburkholderia humisilvae]|uniref:hypothetical protein n=1 Tax=Paraburkholderia humisilvae TaxID=627669 RepID=UPI001C2E84FF|nr:hypothetical protein [Paraburkholderia humisilvae]
MITWEAEATRGASRPVCSSECRWPEDPHGMGVFIRAPRALAVRSEQRDHAASATTVLNPTSSRLVRKRTLSLLLIAPRI